MTRLNMFRSENVLNKSLNKLHGLSLCTILVFNIIFEWLPHLCTQDIQLSVRSRSQAVHFKHRFYHKDQGGFPIPHKEGQLLVKIKQTLNISLSMVKLLITLLMVYQYTQSLQRCRKPPRDFTMRPMVTLKRLQSIHGCDWRKLRMGQWHCSYCTILTYFDGVKRKPVEKKNIKKHASCLNKPLR